MWKPLQLHFLTVIGQHLWRHCWMPPIPIAAKDNTSESLNRGGIADLPLLVTLLAICQKPQEPFFWEVVDSFVLLAYANLAASRTLLQQLKWKKWFLWTVATTQAAENHGDDLGLTWYPYSEGYINSNLNPLTKVTSSSNHLHKNGHKPCDETGHTI